MKPALIVALVLFVVSPAQTEPQTKPSATQIAIDKLRLEMPAALTELTSLDASDRAIDQSNQAQIDTGKMLDTTKRRIETVDMPNLKAKGAAHDEKVRQYVASGCPANGGVAPPEIAKRCNLELVPINAERQALLSALANLKSQLSMIETTRQAVSATTLENVQKQKANAARRDALEATRLAQASQLRRLYLTGISEVVARADLKGKASAACDAMPNLEESVCCHEVVFDERNPAQCSVPLIVSAFEKAGIFGTTIVK